MNKFHRILCMLAALCLLIAPAASAEAPLAEPAAIVGYDRAALIDWTPSYGLRMPGVLLELSHAEAMLTVTSVEQNDLSPAEYLSDRLDRAGETLSVSGALLSSWEGQSGADECLLAYSYTYPDGDEVHLCRIWAASVGDMLIDLTVDAWGDEAEQLIEAALASFVEGGFSLAVYPNTAERTGTLSDVIADENGLVSIQLTAPDESFSPDAPFYPLSETAVVLFPNPDDPLRLCPVQPDYPSLAEAILLYEESSDSPAVFRVIIDQEQIVYMEYGLMQ